MPICSNNLFTCDLLSVGFDCRLPASRVRLVPSFSLVAVCGGLGGKVTVSAWNGSRLSRLLGDEAHENEMMHLFFENNNLSRVPCLFLCSARMYMYVQHQDCYREPETGSGNRYEFEFEQQAWNGASNVEMFSLQPPFSPSTGKQTP
jgi:hypothetical protein